jgi:anti-sigma B factor antagonist
VSGEHHSVVWVGQVAVISLPAEIDVSNADQVREDLLSVINHGATLLVVDMSATTFCDSSGVSALVRAFKRATAGAAGMRLVISAPAVHRILAITGIDRLIDIYPSVAAAMGTADQPATISQTCPRTGRPLAGRAVSRCGRDARRTPRGRAGEPP